MKVRVPILVQDQLSSKRQGVRLMVGRYITDESFHDGPSTGRVAVLDIDPDTGGTVPGARFLPPSGKRTVGRYEAGDQTDVSNRQLHQVLVFSAVNEAMRMFEEPDALGRRLKWAFDEPQLQVIPRAGRDKNAYYERESHSLKFFYFKHPKCRSETVYTSLSRDIVAHETGHAILDGIAPHLYNSITPQSLAIHEAVADLVAVITSFRCKELALSVFKQTKGSIRSSTSFSTVAEEFGSALNGTGLEGYLRNLYNQKSLDPSDQPNYVSATEPHFLCEVLTGALYTVMINLHEAKTAEIAAAKNITLYSASGKALAFSANQFKRMILRALDYLPPGEVSFADYGRAIIAADEASHPNDDRERQWLRDEFARRKIVPTPETLNTAAIPDLPALDVVDLQTLLESDETATRLVNENRAFFYVPPDIPFQVLKRIKTTKLYYHVGKEEMVSELLLKVYWQITEQNRLGFLFSNKRRLVVGTTLAIDWETKRLRVRLTSDRTSNPAEEKEQRQDRDLFLDSMAQAGILKPRKLGLGADSAPLDKVIYADEVDGVMEVHGMGRTLHIVRRD